jgi:hypothetical protein
MPLDATCRRSPPSPAIRGAWGAVCLLIPLLGACHFGLDYKDPVSDTDPLGPDPDSSSDPDTWYRDADGDGYGNPDEAVRSPAQPSGYVADATDCDDGDADAHPGGTEVCDGADNDCNGTIDDDPIDGEIWYADDDNDSWGDPDTITVACQQPSGTATNTFDCDDDDPREPVIADAVSGNSGGSGTWSDPVLRLQTAIDMASGCVLARPGTYAETIDFGGKSITVTGHEGVDNTVIDAGTSACGVGDPEACVSTVTFASGSNASPTLQGFTIRGGSGASFYSSTSTTCADSAPSNEGQNTCTVHLYEYCGGGVRVDGDDPRLVDLVIVDNVLPDFTQESSGSFEQIWRYSYGGGVCVQGGVVSLEGVILRNNQADTGGGVYAAPGSVLSLEHTTLNGNIAADGAGAYLDRADLSATNSLFVCNQADVDGGGVFANGGGTADFTNVSFYGNASSDTGEQRGSQVFQQGTSGTLELHNCILQATSSSYAIYGDGSGRFRYNDVYNSSWTGMNQGGSFSAGANDISADPSFDNAHCSIGSPSSFALSGSSPAIDAGDPDNAYNDEDGSRNDMGAYGGPGGGW